MANTKITLGNIADDAVGLDQLNISNSPSNGQALTYVATSNDLQWATVSGGVDGISTSADATAITINSSEQVGIGTTSPNARLVVSDSGDSPVRFISSGQATNYFELANTGGSAMVFSNNNDLVFGTSNSPTERMRITSAGKVGIDTSSPDAELHIEPVSSNASIILSNDGRTQYFRIQNNETDDALVFNANDANERMRIDSSGRVLVGWTSSVASTAQLQVNSNAKIGNIFLQGDSSNSIISAGNGQFKVSSLEIRGGGSGLDFDVTLIKTGVGFTNMFKVDSPSGDTFTNDGTISSLSDERIKTDINDLADGLDIVKQLRPVTFKYNDTTEDEEGKKELGTADDTVRYGFIAQEVEAVAPHYVETSTRKINNEEVDDFKSMSTTRMIPMLFKAIQELSAKNDALEARIETLESN